MTDKPSQEQSRGSSHSTDKPDRFKIDAEALAALRSSGVLNPNVTLDQIMSLSEKLSAQTEGVVVQAAFIFRDFVFRPC